MEGSVSEIMQPWDWKNVQDSPEKRCEENIKKLSSFQLFTIPSRFCYFGISFAVFKLHKGNFCWLALSRHKININLEEIYWSTFSPCIQFSLLLFVWATNLQIERRKGAKKVERDLKPQWIKANSHRRRCWNKKCK